MMTDREFVAWVVDNFEGHAFVDHPDDPGGATKYGVTLATLQAIRPGATVDDVKALTFDEAVLIMRVHYVLEPRIDRIHSVKVRMALIDFGIHSGPARAIRALQRVLRVAGHEEVAADGVIGPMTVQATYTVDAGVLANRIIARRLDMMTRLRHYDSFSRGWPRRIARLLLEVNAV